MSLLGFQNIQVFFTERDIRVNIPIKLIIKIYIIHVYLPTGHEDNSKLIVPLDCNYLPYKIVAISGNNKLDLSEKSINRYFIIPKKTLSVSDPEFADVKQISVIRL